MAGLTCVYCQAENTAGEQLCRACFRRLPAGSTPLSLIHI